MGDIPTSTLLSDYLRHTQDASANNKTNGQNAINHYYQFLYAQADNYVDERTKYTDLSIGQRSYLLPPDYFKIKRVRVKVSNIWYPLRRITNLDEWAELTFRDISGPIPYAYTVINEQGNMHIEIDLLPTTNLPASLEIVYEGYLNRLQFPDIYATGHVGVNLGSMTIAGTGTSFTTAGNLVGQFIRPTGGRFWYEINAVQSDTQLQLVSVFQEPTITSSTYQIAELSRLPREFDYTPVWAAIADYWAITNIQHGNTYLQKYTQELQFLESKYRSKTTGSVTPGTPIAPKEPSWPRNYPRTRIG